MVTSEKQLPFQCRCLIKTSQAAPLDCFDASGPIVHKKNQRLDRWGRGAGRGERRGRRVVRVGKRMLVHVVVVGGMCVWGGSEEAFCRGI